MPDHCVKMLLSDGYTRVSAVVLTSAVQEAARCHGASAVASVALGRVMVASALLGTTVRPTGRVNVQIVGNGPLGALVVDAHGNGTVRGYARRPKVALPVTAGHVEVAPAVGKEGFIHVLLAASEEEGFSRATCQLASGEVDDDVMVYLTQSVQVESALGSEVVLDGDGKVACAVGVLVQLMPGGSAGRTVFAQEVLRGGGIHALLEGGNILDARQLVQRLYPGEALQELEERAWSWHCSCSRERVLGAISTLGPQEVGNILQEDGKAEVTCDFCNNVYSISKDDLTALLVEMEAHRAGGPEVA